MALLTDSLLITPTLESQKQKYDVNRPTPRLRVKTWRPCCRITFQVLKMKKQFKQPVVTFNNPAVYASPDGLQEEDIYMNTESACTVDEMPRDTTEDIDEIQTPSIIWSSPPVTVAVCWGILLVIMALRIHFTSVISTELSTSKEVHQHLMLTNKDFTQVKKENQQVKEENQQVKEENQQVKEENQQVKEENQQVKKENQQVKEENQQVKEENQQVKVENQQVKEENQQVKEENQQVKVENQQVKEENQQLKVEIQQVNTTTPNQTMFWS